MAGDGRVTTAGAGGLITPVPATGFVFMQKASPQSTLQLAWWSLHLVGLKETLWWK